MNNLPMTDDGTGQPSPPWFDYLILWLAFLVTGAIVGSIVRILL